MMFSFFFFNKINGKDLFDTKCNGIKDDTIKVEIQKLPTPTILMTTSFQNPSYRKETNIKVCNKLFLNVSMMHLTLVFFCNQKYC